MYDFFQVILHPLKPKGSNLNIIFQTSIFGFQPFVFQRVYQNKTGGRAHNFTLKRGDKKTSYLFHLFLLDCL